ncbi:unnamed protein product, partial [Rhizoctonia solani]
MANGIYRLPKKALVFLAIMQCTTQGILVTLLATFLTSESKRPYWFKIYVVCVNALAAGQTVVHLVQALNAINSIPTPAPPQACVYGGHTDRYNWGFCSSIFYTQMLEDLPPKNITDDTALAPVVNFFGFRYRN